MTPADFALLRSTVARDEGLRLHPYQDTEGKTSIGYGRNLTDNGISEAEAEAMLNRDLNTAVDELTQAFPFVLAFDGVRQVALASMVYNLGLAGASKFVKMWAALRVADFDTAATEMLSSAWAQQVGARATRLAEAVRSGELK